MGQVNNIQEYCSNLTNYQRWPTQEVMVGDVSVGGSNPIRIQSMTTTDTMNTDETIEQSIRMIDAGCEIVRITAPSIKEAKNLELIHHGLRKRGHNAPLVADIHFTPNAAELAARIVEKVRINPGNFADRKKFELHDYTDRDYENELERINNRFSPLVKICKEYGTAMRIGTNHGSLSDRILSRYGDTPLGMVESAMEFIRICEYWNYYDIILSMKASNTQVMVQAYRLLVKKMADESMNYPLHLGVTEAGDGEDGRIKSSVGIGTLLEDGIGDTIRVSLTEEPENEIPVAKILAARYNRGFSTDSLGKVNSLPYDPYFHSKRETLKVNNIGSEEVPRVFANLSNLNIIKPEDLSPLGYLYSKDQDKWHLSDQAVDYIYVGDNKIEFELPGTLSIVQNSAVWDNNIFSYPVFDLDSYEKAPARSDILNFIFVEEKIYSDKINQLLTEDKTVVVILMNSDAHSVMVQRKFIIDMMKRGVRVPVIINRAYNTSAHLNFQLKSSTDIGSLLIDGLGDGVWLEFGPDKGLVNQTVFGILQASRMRISKTEYISCPSCGRTLFDLQETTSKIREVTNHLKGVKIGIMGCIVNGPGEMADADYGYVGTGSGYISLYKGQNLVKRNIPTDRAVDALIDLIKEHGDWIDSVPV